MILDTQSAIRYLPDEARQQVVSLSERVHQFSQSPQRLSYAPEIIMAINFMVAQIEYLTPHRKCHQSQEFFSISSRYLNRYRNSFSSDAVNEEIFSKILSDIALDILNVGCSEENLNRTLVISQFVHALKTLLNGLDELQHSLSERKYPADTDSFFIKFRKHAFSPSINNYSSDEMAINYNFSPAL